MNAAVPGADASLVVENAYQWVGNSGMGGIAVYVDGKRAGVAKLGGSLKMRITPGQHTLRVRLWWYFSPAVTLNVGVGQTRRFTADIPRDGMVLARIVRGMFDPLHSLSLDEVPDPSRSR